MAEVVDHGVPNRLIEKIEGYDPDNKDIKIIVHIETEGPF